MITDTTQQIFYSWEEFGLIVKDLSEKIEEHPRHVTGLTCHEKGSFILAYSLCEKLRLPLYVERQPTTLDVGLTNLKGADVVVTYFQHEQADQFGLLEPIYYYDQQVVDVEGRQAKIIFPWQ